MPNFLNRSRGGRLRVGVFNEPVVIAWVSTNAARAQVSASSSGPGTDRPTSTDTSGQFTLNRPGTYTVAYQFHFSQRGTVRISAGGTEKVNRNNNRDSTRQVDAGPCAEYSIPNARTPCRPGYARTSYQENRVHWRFTSRSQRVSTGIREWGRRSIANRQVRADEGFGTGGGSLVITRVEYRTVYACTPAPNCRETRTVNDGYQALLHGTFNVSVSAPRPVQPSQPPPQPQQPQPQQPQPPPQVVAPPTIAPAPRQTLTYTRARYEVITPARYVESGGQIRPELRYRSVRELTAPEVSNLIALGYSIQSVPPDTPLVESAAYGPSVVAASAHNAPNTVPVITRREPRERVGIASRGRAAAQAAPVSSNWRDRGRRVVR